MELVTREQMDALLANGRRMMEDDISTSVWPVVKLFTTDARALPATNGATYAASQQAANAHAAMFYLNDCRKCCNATWLLAWVEPDEPDVAWGLADLGYPEIGPVSLREIAGVRGALGLPVERDLYFEAEKSLLEYASEARERGYIAA